MGPGFISPECVTELLRATALEELQWGRASSAGAASHRTGLAAQNGSSVSSIIGWIGSASNGLAWNGSGITSSSADSTTTGVGALDNGSGQVKIAAARYGDANLDNHVDTMDFTALAMHFGAAGARWLDGDFNYDGSVNALDFNALASSYGSGIGSASATPAMVAASAAPPSASNALSLWARPSHEAAPSDRKNLDWTETE